MNYQVIHRTEYAYETDVSVAHHLLHMTPLDTGRQRLLEHELRLDPPPRCRRAGEDYFGNRSVFITLEKPHRRFEIVAQSRVEIQAAAWPLPLATPAWDAAPPGDSQAAASAAAGEFRFNSPLIQQRSEYADYARASFPAGRPLLDAVLDLTRRIHQEFVFDPQATSVSTPIEQAFKERRGVCQDFAQVQLACLRSLGIPARYVSGYLETLPPPGQPKLAGADASHAWVSFFCPGHGWIEVDPTNDLLASERHIVTAYGRDFGDVSPARGVILGGGCHTLKVGVDVLPMPAP